MASNPLKRLGNWLSARTGYHPGGAPPVPAPPANGPGTPGYTGQPLGGYRPPSATGSAFVNNSTQPVIPPISIQGSTDPGKIEAAGKWIKDHWDALGNLSELEKWSIALSAVGNAFTAYTNYQQGEQRNALSKEQLAEQGREFDVTNELNQKRFGEEQRQFNLPKAVDLSRSNDLAPLRDRATYLIGQRLGMNSSPFQGANLNNPGGAPSGIDPNQMAMANNSYTPWAGGTKPGVDLRKRILDTLGYGS